MEQALENYDICTELLQSSTAIQAEAGTEQRDIIIRLPNLYNDSVVSLEEVSGSYLTVFSWSKIYSGLAELDQACHVLVEQKSSPGTEQGSYLSGEDEGAWERQLWGTRAPWTHSPPSPTHTLRESPSRWQGAGMEGDLRQDLE